MVKAKEQKTAQLTIRVKPGIKRLMQERADAHGRSVASYLERLTLAEADRDKPKRG
jgi:uncharacterized protein (DUF1778 family)